MAILRGIKGAVLSRALPTLGEFYIATLLDVPIEISNNTLTPLYCIFRTGTWLVSQARPSDGERGSGGITLHYIDEPSSGSHELRTDKWQLSEYEALLDLTPGTLMVPVGVLRVAVVAITGVARGWLRGLEHPLCAGRSMP